jgi:hypothetical protein
MNISQLMRKLGIHFIATGIGLILGVILAGCVSTYCTYETPNGSKLSVHRRNLFVKTEMPTLKFNPDGSVEFIGYNADGGINAVNAAIEAATKGAIKGVTGK